MDRPAPPPVVFLPGGVTSVALSCAPLLEELGGEISPFLKDLEVFPEDDDRFGPLTVRGLAVVAASALAVVGLAGDSASLIRRCSRHG